MTPNVECEETQRLNVENTLPVPIHQGRRVLPEQSTPARAWLENEFDRDAENTSPGEQKRLLSNLSQSPISKSKHQTCCTLGKHKKNGIYRTPSFEKPKTKSKFKDTSERILAVIKPPYFIISMIIVLVCVHLFVPAELRLRLEWSPHAWWREPWRIVTYGCTHASAAHLALNAVVALAVGWRLEHEQQWWRVVCVWVGGVVAGALGAGVLQPQVRVVGASAAVYALLTAHLPNVCLRFGNIPLWWFRPLSVLVLGASEGCWALVGAPVLTAATARHRQQYDHVAWSAHVLGAAVGIPLAFVFFQADEENTKKTYIRVCRAISAVLLVSGVIYTIVYYT